MIELWHVFINVVTNNDRDVTCIITRGLKRYNKPVIFCTHTVLQKVMPIVLNSHLIRRSMIS